MLVEVINNHTPSETDSTENLYARMERPKSAKYNLERYKKASAHASRFNRVQNYEDETGETRKNGLEERRYQCSKSAYAGRLRPKSARHNLEKYRQDALREQQLQISKTNVNQDKEDTLDADEDEIDNLEGLLIGEEDSVSELDSDSIATQETKKKSKNKAKLLSKRAVNARLTVGPQVLLNNLPNKNSNLNTYTTFRPTAVTTNYSTNHNGLKVVHLHSDKENENLDQTNGSINTTTTTNSSSSSSTSSSKLQPVLHEHTDNTEKNRYKNSHNEATSRDLLNDWLKNDEEVDLNTKNDQDVIDENFFYSSKYQKNIKTNRFAPGPVSGRTTRSDYSSNSSFSHTKTTESSAFFSREKSGMSDPWAKRNPALIAQNVLLKHRAELEQITANRANNNSRTSNTPSFLSQNATTPNRCLLPETKYFKK